VSCSRDVLTSYVQSLGHGLQVQSVGFGLGLKNVVFHRSVLLVQDKEHGLDLTVRDERR